MGKAPLNHKILFTGPTGAGKTSAIGALSDIPIASTQNRAGDGEGSTAVALDYGSMRLGDSERIHLYGIPNQERFNKMRDILTDNSIGLILLVDNSRPEPFADMFDFINAFHDFIDRTHVVIGVTHTDLKPVPYIDEYHRAMDGAGIRYPIFEVDPRRREDVSLLVQTLLYLLDPGLSE